MESDEKMETAKYYLIEQRIDWDNNSDFYGIWPKIFHYCSNEKKAVDKLRKKRLKKPNEEFRLRSFLVDNDGFHIKGTKRIEDK